MPVTTIDGVTIHYNETGEGEPLLLIMGYGMPGDAWLGSLPFLHGFRCIYYDNRGTGRSDKPAGPYTIVQMADDAAGLLDHLGIARAHVYGVSMGGMIAQELVLRHPTKVRSLVLGCTLCGGEHSVMGDPQIIETLVDVVGTMGTGDPAPWVDRQLPLLFTPEWIAANRPSATSSSRWLRCSRRRRRRRHTRRWPACSGGPATTVFRTSRHRR
jgi:pimeloyl-ACP methyl ester carboxylesterase